MTHGSFGYEYEHFAELPKVPGIVETRVLNLLKFWQGIVYICGTFTLIVVEWS